MVLGIDSGFGLPVHPLVVHVAVVLVPLAAFALIALGWKGEWRQRYALPIAVLALAGGAAAILAASSGETLVSSVRQAAGTRVGFGEHPEQGDAARLFAVLFAGAATGLWILETWREQLKLQPWTSTAAYLGSSVLGVVAIATMIVAGHSGAMLVWKDVGNFVSSSR
jgi:uncharacterized membrane protein